LHTREYVKPQVIGHIDLDAPQTHGVAPAPEKEKKEPQPDTSPKEPVAAPVQAPAVPEEPAVAKQPEPEPEPGDGEIELPIGDIDFDHDFTLLADDFAIRVNGDYMEDIVVDGNTATLNNILIAHGDDMIIKVSGLDETNILEGNDYTYECYIWVNNTKLLDDGTGAYGPLFDEALYKEWVNPSWDPYTNDDFGCDMTSRITGVTSPAGYVVRYNVYRGLSGHVDSDTGYGDTPYLKVSIHVQRDPSAPANTCVGVYPEIK